MDALDLDDLRHHLRTCCEDARIDPASVILFVVDSLRPPGTTPLAYLQPTARLRRDTVLVFRAVGDLRIDALRLHAHRFAIWRALPGIPDAALGPMLRHELEHARRFERSGPAFYEADARLRAAVSRAGGEGYVRLPSEREANAAASAYAARTLTALERRAVADCDACAALLTRERAPSDVVGETLAELARLVDAGATPPASTEDACSAEAVGERCEKWGGREPLDLVDGRTATLIELVAPFASA